MDTKQKGRLALLTWEVESETSLVSKAQKGDRGAFGELVSRCHPQVVAVVYRYCGDLQLAEDAAQDAFIQAWLHLSSYHPTSPFRCWMFRIAINAALKVLRRKSEAPMQDVDEISTLPDPQVNPSEALITHERAALVQKAVMALTPPTRAVLVLREYGELSYQEIASALDIPIGTVMSRLNYARSRLRELLEPELLLMEDEHA